MLFKIRPTLARSLMLLWCSHFMLDFFTGIWPIYKTIAGIDLAKAGLISGISGFVGELFQLFFGYFSDRGQRKKILMLGLTLASSVLLITFTQQIATSFIILLMLTLGSGAFHPAAVGYAGLLSPTKRGRNILLFASGGAFGLSLSQLIFTKTLSLCDGNALPILIPVLVLIAFIAIYPVEEQTENKKLSLKEFFQPIMQAKRPILLLYLTQVFNYTLFVAILFLLPDLMRAKGCDEWLCMGGGHLCFVLGGAIVMIPIGYLSDRFDTKTIVLLQLLTSLVLLYTFLNQKELSTWATILYVTALGGIMGPVTSTLVSWANKIVPENPSTVSALLMGLAWSLSNLGATWAGLIAKTVTVNPIVTTLSVLGLLLVLDILLVLFIPKEASKKQPVAQPLIGKM